MISPRLSIHTDLRSSLRRRRIVDAATRLFATTRYDAVQIDDVARAAGVAKPTLYRYFATKEDLFLEGFDALLGGVADEMTAVVETCDKAARALPEMIGILLDRLGGHNAGVRMLDVSKEQFGPHARARLRARTKQIRGSLAAVLRRGVEQDEFRDIDADLVAAAIIGSLRTVATKISRSPARHGGARHLRHIDWRHRIACRARNFSSAHAGRRTDRCARRRLEGSE